jgi:D-ribulokinase
VLISGGAGQHDLVRQILAGACGVAVVATEAAEPVLLGSAILAAGGYADIPAAMSRPKHSFTPAGGAHEALHVQRYHAFQTLQAAARVLRVKP